MLKMPTILIIDSNLMFRRILIDIIRKRFPELNIAEARDADEGLHKAICERPQLVITDLHLEGAISLAMIQQIAAQQPEARIAVLTDRDEEEYRKAALERGADYFISKSGPDGHKVLSIIQKRLLDA